MIREQYNPAHAATNSSGRVRRAALGLAGVTVAAGTIMILSANGATAAPTAAPQTAAPKVTLCHRTDAETNPYVQITVAAAAAYNGHYKEHQGDVWYPGHPKKPHWGDIIPPFVYQAHTYSLNWNAAGQAIFNNGCKPPASTTTSSTAASSTAASSTAASSTAASSTAASSTAASSTAASSSSSSGSFGISGAATSSASSPASSSSLGISGAAVSSSDPPIPGGVSAGLHTPVGRAGLKAWGIVLMLLGGAAGLIAGLWPTRRRAH